jgi:AcrR family transcriptional regulator
LAAPTVERNLRSEAARAARREDILDAARRVFAERGFRGTTIADIAEAAGIALGTIYLYFKSKDDVFAALSQRLGELISQAFLAPPTESTLDGVVRGRVRDVFKACAQNRDLVRLVVLNTDPQTRSRQRDKRAEVGHAQPLADSIAQAAERGWIRNDDPAVMARLIFGLASIAVYQAYVISDGDGADALCEGTADMIVAYLTPAEGNEREAGGNGDT